MIFVTGIRVTMAVMSMVMNDHSDDAAAHGDDDDDDHEHGDHDQMPRALHISP